jgi:hypothetical protein
VSLQGGIEYIGRFGMKEGDEIVIGVEEELGYHPIQVHDFKQYDPVILSETIWEIAYYELVIQLKAMQSYGFEERLTCKCASLLVNAYEDNQNIRQLRTLQPHSFFTFDFRVIRNNTNKLVIFEDDAKSFKIPYKNQIIDAPLRYLRPYMYFSNEEYSEELILSKTRWTGIDFQQTSIYDFDPRLIKIPTSMLAHAKLEENGSNLAVVLKKILADTEKSKSLIRMTKYLLPFIKNVTVEKSLNKSLQFSINESHNEAVNLPNFLLSDGTVTVMATLVALAYEENKVAIFEEPERGIHPQLISKMMGLFYSITAETGKKQVIITTHNPEWLNHAKVEDILIFERNQQGMCEISRIKDREGVKSYLEDDLRIDTLFVNDLLHN